MKRSMKGRESKFFSLKPRYRMDHEKSDAKTFHAIVRSRQKKCVEYTCVAAYVVAQFARAESLR
jgi:hypothetical protein